MIFATSTIILGTLQVMDCVNVLTVQKKLNPDYF